MSGQAVVAGGFWFWPSSRDVGVSLFSCSPPSLGIVLQLHACAEGSCREKEITGGCPIAGSLLGIQPGRGCVVFLQHEIREYSRVELGETIWSTDCLGFEHISSGKCGLQVTFQLYIHPLDLRRNVPGAWVGSRG